MTPIFSSDFVRCIFTDTDNNNKESKVGKVDVFIAETGDIVSMYMELVKYISGEEKLRAEKLYSEQMKETYVICHSLLRLILAKMLGQVPQDVKYITGESNKPALEGNPVYFNITHTANAFAICVSEDFYLGADMEEMNRKIDIHPIIEYYFSSKEREFILTPGTEQEIRRRFFLLWTRKEALLKAFGTGIIENISQIEVCSRENVISRKLFDDKMPDCEVRPLWLYSGLTGNSYLTVAVPGEASFSFYRLNAGNIVSYLNNN